jgi:hypothetical protein
MRSFFHNQFKREQKSVMFLHGEYFLSGTQEIRMISIAEIATSALADSQ